MEYIDRVMQTVIDRNPNEPEFHQAVREVLSSLKPVIEKHPEYEKNAILERIVEPDRLVTFKVPWVDDKGEVPCEPRLPRAVQQRHRPVQGRPAPAPVGVSGHNQVPGL